MTVCEEYQKAQRMRDIARGRGTDFRPLQTDGKSIEYDLPPELTPGQISELAAEG